MDINVTFKTRLAAQVESKTKTELVFVEDDSTIDEVYQQVRKYFNDFIDSKNLVDASYTTVFNGTTITKKLF